MLSHADEDVTGQRRAVEEVARSQAPLLALDHKDALAAQDQERLLGVLAVVPRVELRRLENAQVDAELREAGVARLGRACDPHPLVALRREVRHVDDEPALAHRPRTLAGVLDPGFTHLLGNAVSIAPPVGSVVVLDNAAPVGVMDETELGAAHPDQRSVRECHSPR